MLDTWFIFHPGRLRIEPKHVTAMALTWAVLAMAGHVAFQIYLVVKAPYGSALGPECSALTLAWAGLGFTRVDSGVCGVGLVFVLKAPSFYSDIFRREESSHCRYHVCVWGAGG